VTEKHKLWVCSDEIYDKLVYTSEPSRSWVTLLGGIPERTVIVNGVSKAYAMTGWRIGWTLAPAPLTAAMDNLQSQETSNPCSISQHATVAALSGSQQCVADMLTEFTRRREYTLSRVRQLPGVSMPEPGGAFYAFFNISRHLGKPLSNGRVCRDSTEFCTALLEDAHVALVSGDAFGAPGYARLSFATGLANLEAGFDRIAGLLKS
jgi:aspartate aminotransferase